MRDPHVVSLRYRLVPDGDDTFDQPPPIERETEAFHMRLADDVATFTMISHFSSVEAAREPVERYLQAWELSAALQSGRPDIRFTFEEAQVIDRDPPPVGTPQIHYGAAELQMSVTVSATGHVITHRYPDPPDKFVVSRDVETLYARFQGYLKGQEPLDAMGYACLTLLEANTGSRAQAAKTYGIGRTVLNTLARLTTEVGDLRTRRKFVAGTLPRSHTASEKHWVEAAVTALIKRVGEWAADPTRSMSKLTMDDLPKLQ